MKAIKTKGIVLKANVTCNNITPSSDFVLSGFTQSNYAIIPNVYLSGKWKFVIKVNTGGNITTNGKIIGRVASAFDPLLSIGNSKFILNLSTNGSSWGIASDKAGTNTLTTNTDYYVSLEFTGTNYILKYSTNGNDWIEDINIASTSTVYNKNLLALGVSPYNGYQFAGSIDLKECYININGQRSWSGVKDVQVDRYLMAK